MARPRSYGTVRTSASSLLGTLMAPPDSRGPQCGTTLRGGGGTDYPENLWFLSRLEAYGRGVATDRVERARHRIQALAVDASDGAEYRDGVLRLLRDVVPWNAAVLTQFDPVTTLPTAGTGLGVDLGDCCTALELEFLHDDVDTWA